VPSITFFPPSRERTSLPPVLSPLGFGIVSDLAHRHFVQRRPALHSTVVGRTHLSGFCSKPLPSCADRPRSPDRAQMP
jgi:hypothetical protein